MNVAPDRRKLAASAKADKIEREMAVWAGGLARKLYRSSGLRCCNEPEFVIWYGMGLQCKGGAEGQVKSFCKTPPLPWCLDHEEQGRCMRGGAWLISRFEREDTEEEEEDEED